MILLKFSGDLSTKIMFILRKLATSAILRAKEVTKLCSGGIRVWDIPYAGLYCTYRYSATYQPVMSRIYENVVNSLLF